MCGLAYASSLMPTQVKHSATSGRTFDPDYTAPMASLSTLDKEPSFEVSNLTAAQFLADFEAARPPSCVAWFSKVNEQLRRHLVPDLMVGGDGVGMGGGWG